MEELMQMLAEDIHVYAILTEPVSLSTKTELSHSTCGIEKSTKISLPVVRQHLETEIVDNSQNTDIEPMPTSPQVNITAKDFRKNECK